MNAMMDRSIDCFTIRSYDRAIFDSPMLMHMQMSKMSCLLLLLLLLLGAILAS